TSVDISTGLLPGLFFQECVYYTCGYGYGGPSLYKESDLEGLSQAFGHDVFDLTSEFIGNQVRSVSVPEGWTLWLYPEANYMGVPTKYVGNSVANVGTAVKSLKTSFS